MTQTTAELPAPGKRTIIVIDASPSTPGGFTIGLALASQDPRLTEPTVGMPATDVVALALVETAKTMPPTFKSAMDRIQEHLTRAAEAVAAGADPEAAVASEFEG